MCLADELRAVSPENSERRKEQESTGIRVVVGNPPYSMAQHSQSDNKKTQTIKFWISVLA